MCVKYNKSNLRQNSVKGPTDPNSEKITKIANIVKKFAKKNATKKQKIETLLTFFFTKQPQILQRLYTNIYGMLVCFYNSVESVRN